MPRKKKSGTRIPETRLTPEPQLISSKGSSYDIKRVSSNAWNTDGAPYNRHNNEETYSPGKVIRNQFFSGDGTDPAESLRSLQEIFKGKLESDVVQLVFSECSYNVDQALETLFKLNPENENTGKVNRQWNLPTTSVDVPSGSKVNSSRMALRGGGTDNSSLNAVPTLIAGPKKSTWNSISVSSDSSSDCASLKDYDSSDTGRNLRHMSRNHQHYVDVVYHKSERSFNGSGQSLNMVARGFSSVPPNPSSFNFNSSSDMKSTDSIFSSKSAIDEASLLIQSKRLVLIILRGLPGSGKSTLARKLKYSGAVFSTDDYFISNNNYKFNPTLLTEAHEWNKARTLCALENALSPIIIDNTNIESWEIKPYIFLGTKFKYKIIILEPNTLWKFNVSELARRNTHGVSKEKISRMLERYEQGITVESFNLGDPEVETPTNATPPISLSKLEDSGNKLAVPGTPERSKSASQLDRKLLEPSPRMASRSRTPEMRKKSSESSSKTSLSSDNIENSSCTSSQSSLGLRDPQRLDLADLLALTHQGSEDSLSVSRRTSASSSHDTSGWECDEEFLWSGEDIPRSPSVRTFLKGDIPEESEDFSKKEQESERTKGKGHAVFQWSLSENSTQNNIVGSPKPNSDWTMPSYPVIKKEPVSTSNTASNAIKPLCHTASQTTSNDFVELQSVNHIEKISSAIIVLTGRVHLSSCAMTSQPPEKPILKYPVFDKSTMTEEDLNGAEVDRTKHLAVLQTMFPSISLGDLEDIMEKCHWDHDWAVNILIDFGLEFNDVNCKVKPVEVEKFLQVEAKEAVTNVCNEKQFENSEDLPPLVMSLEPAFAYQLEEMFGFVRLPICKDRLSSEDLQVTLEPALALQIHTLWKNSLSNKPPSAKSPEKTGADKARSQASTPTSMTSSPSSKKTPVVPIYDAHWSHKEVPSLAEIMTLEASLETRRQELLKSQQSSHDALATKLGRLKLYDLFPGIDKLALDEMYEANNYKVSLTLLSLQETLGDGPSGGPWLSPELAHCTEEELCRLAQEDSLKQANLFDPDWRSWVADLSSESPNQFSTSPETHNDQAVPGYEELRSEASLHYRMQRECFQKSSDAYRRGMKAVASFYSQQGHLHGKKLKEANERASEKILEIKNVSSDQTVLDLHGQHVSEALNALKQFLETKEDEFRRSPHNRSVLSVITGRGAHSTHQGPKLRPAVQEYLQRQNYKFETVHEGEFRITLT